MNLIEEIKNIDNSSEKRRKFGWTIGIAFLVLTLVLILLGRGLNLVLLSTGVTLIILAIIFPRWLKYVHLCWMGFALILGRVMNAIILSILFYLVFTTIGFISRLLRKRFLETGWRTDAQSYWNYRDRKEVNSSDYEKQY